MNILKIRVAHKSSVIEYEQTVTDSSTFAATAAKDYSRANNQEALIDTIREMCKEVKDLGNSGT